MRKRVSSDWECPQISGSVRRTDEKLTRQILETAVKAVMVQLCRSGRVSISSGELMGMIQSESRELEELVKLTLKYAPRGTSAGKWATRCLNGHIPAWMEELVQQYYEGRYFGGLSA